MFYNLARVENPLLHVKIMKGVDEARMDIAKDFIFEEGWLDEIVDSRAAA